MHKAKQSEEADWQNPEHDVSKHSCTHGRLLGENVEPNIRHNHIRIIKPKKQEKKKYSLVVCGEMCPKKKHGWIQIYLAG